MIQRETDPQEIFINKEHIDSAYLASTSGSKQSSYDRFDHKDSYYKTPENERLRTLETIRQTADEAKKIIEVIPAYLINKTYEENDDGHGQIYQYSELIRRVMSLSGFYSHNYSGGTINENLSTILDSLQESIDKFQSQIKDIIIEEEPERFKYKLVATQEPFISILKEPGDSWVSDLRKKYGSVYILHSELMEWVWHKRNFNIKNKTERLTKIIGDREKREYYVERRKEILEISTKLRKLSLESINSFDHLKALDILYSTEHKNFSFSDQDTFPELASAILIYEQDKDEIYKKLEEYFLSKPEELLELEIEKLGFLLQKSRKTDDQKLISTFITICSPEQLVEFIDKDYAFPSIHISYIYYEENDSDETINSKKDKLGKLAMRNFAKSSFDRFSLEQNEATFSYLAGYLIYLKKENAEQFNKEINTFIEAIPKYIFFLINHRAQMNNFISFLEYLFIEEFDKNDVPENAIRQLINKTESHDNRKPDVNENFSALKSKLQRRYSIAMQTNQA